MFESTMLARTRKCWCGKKHEKWRKMLSQNRIPDLIQKNFFTQQMIVCENGWMKPLQAIFCEV